MAVGVIVLYPYHNMDPIVWCNITSAGPFPSGDLGFLDEPAAILRSFSKRVDSMDGHIRSGTDLAVCRGRYYRVQYTVSHRVVRL